MASYIKASMERSYAESFLSELERNENQYFFFVAKSTSWNNDNSPPVYTDTVASECRLINDIIGYKKITPADVLFALPRYTWTSGTVYDQYDDAVALFDSTNPKIFYVVTDENHIYKCMGNNNGGLSTVKPSHTNTTISTLSDGYSWKYLATVRESDMPFELTDYIPVDIAKNNMESVDIDTETTNQYTAQVLSVPGTIDRVVLSGSGWVGASAGQYPYTLSGAFNGSNFISDFIQISSYERRSSNESVITIRDTSRDRLNALSGNNPGNFVGYIFRITESTANSNDVDNYGVISGIDSSDSNSIKLILTDDAFPFRMTLPQTGFNQYVRGVIQPYIRIIGNGSGAYVFADMNINKTIRSVSVSERGMGRNYTNAFGEIITVPSSTTLRANVRVVLSNREGHGSNLLRELNVKDVLVVVNITDEDAETIRGGGTYRQFGIIKNPVLADGSSIIAGSQYPYYRDILLVSDDGFLDVGDFSTSSATGQVFIVGDETCESAKIVQASVVYSLDGQKMKLKTVNTSGKFVTRWDRPDDFILTLHSSPSVPFRIGETAVQTIPSGTAVGSGIVYGYDITVTGTVVSVEQNTVNIRLTGGGNFVPSATAFLTGLISGVTAAISFGGVKPRYGEYVRIGKTEDTTSIFERNGIEKVYRVESIGPSYYDTNRVPSYSGLHKLELTTSVSGATGFVDVTSSPLTQSSYSVGDLVVQGSTAAGSNYAVGVVYDWNYKNPANGDLYLTGVTGSFLSVETSGLTRSRIGPYIVAAYKKPDIDTTSGDILYINNVRPIHRISGQKEEFRLRLGF